MDTGVAILNRCNLDLRPMSGGDRDLDQSGALNLGQSEYHPELGPLSDHAADRILFQFI